MADKIHRITSQILDDWNHTFMAELVIDVALNWDFSANAMDVEIQSVWFDGELQMVTKSFKRLVDRTLTKERLEEMVEEDEAFAFVRHSRRVQFALDRQYEQWDKL